MTAVSTGVKESRLIDSRLFSSAMSDPQTAAAVDQPNLELSHITTERPGGATRNKRRRQDFTSPKARPLRLIRPRHPHGKNSRAGSASARPAR
jgi:hypothetical protein